MCVCVCVCVCLCVCYLHTFAVLFSCAALNFILRRRVRAYTTVRLVEIRVRTCGRRGTGG